MPDGCYADGTWELKMYVTDLHRDVSLRVTGEIHIGGVMLKLVEKLGMVQEYADVCLNNRDLDDSGAFPSGWTRCSMCGVNNLI